MKTLGKIIEEIENLKKAYDLLELVWLEIGPYDNEISDTTRRKLCNYFNFDDGE